RAGTGLPACPESSSVAAGINGCKVRHATDVPGAKIGIAESAGGIISNESSGAVLVLVVDTHSSQRDAGSEIRLNPPEQRAGVAVGRIRLQRQLKRGLRVRLPSLPGQHLRQTGESFRVAGI